MGDYKPSHIETDMAEGRVLFSIAFEGDEPLGNYSRYATRMEEYSFYSFQSYDHLMYKPAWPVLFTIAGQTKKLQLGPVTTQPFFVHPALTAANLACLDELSGGRALIGLSRGFPFYLDMLSLKPEKPVTALKETIEIIDRLLRGTRESYTGSVFKMSKDTYLRWKPFRTRIPIFIGTWGTRMFQLAGKMDAVKGTVTDTLWNPKFVPVIKDNLRRGATEVGRDPESLIIGARPLTSVSMSKEMAEKTVKSALVNYLPHLSPLSEYAGIDEHEIQEVRAAAARGDLSRAERAISEKSVRSFTATGTPDEIIDQTEEMIRAGVRHIIYGYPLGPSREEAIRLIGRDVIPYFQ